MADDSGPGSDRLSGGRPTSGRSSRRSQRRGRTIFPTVFGAILIATVLSSALFRLPVADSSVMGLVWAGLAAATVIGIIFPIASIGMLRVEINSAPRDLTVGQLSSIEVEMKGRASGLRVRCGRSPMYVLDLTSPSTVKLPLEIAQRGIYDHIPIEISTDAPFSILTVSERRILPVSRPLVVGPAVIQAQALIGEITGDDHDRPSIGYSNSGDTVRSVRPYVSGDPAHMVHWPSSARIGSLVVRELEPPRTEGVAVVLVVKGDAGDVEVERAVSIAAGIGQNALDRGARLMLSTHTRSGPLCAEVTGPLDLQRRLAAATSGQPANPPDGWPLQTVVEGAGASSV